MDLNSKNIWTTFLDLNLSYDILGLDLKSTGITLLSLDWFYDILEDMNLKNTCVNLLDSNWFCYKEAGMLLEKYENFFE